MTNNGNVTAQSVDARVDKMGHVFNKLEKRLDAVHVLVTGMLAADDIESEKLLKEIEELQASLKNTPVAVREVTDKLITVKKDITSREGRCGLIEANLLLNVYAEIDPDNGKPTYSNEKQRSAALDVAKAHDEEYQALQSEMMELETERARLDAQLDELENRYKTDRAIYGGCIARLENFTARINL